MSFVICAFYKFVPLRDYRDLREPLQKLMNDQAIRGTVLLAGEGINGTVSGRREAVDALLDWLRRDKRLADIECKESLVETQPFQRSRVKLKKEIVTMGIDGVDPNRIVGTYVAPKEWNRLISDPEVLLIDARNDYEIEVGAFKGAVSPNTKSFRDFPNYVQKNLDPEKHKKVAVYCTGGIRCEKSTSYLRELGFEEVYHLKGGILKYLEEVPEDETLWEGECYVFDERVAVNHRLEKGISDQCRACGLPLDPRDKESEHYHPGLSCPHCHDKLTPRQRERFQERMKQIRLAKERGEKHIGIRAETMVSRREEKHQRKAKQRN